MPLPEWGSLLNIRMLLNSSRENIAPSSRVIGRDLDGEIIDSGVGRESP